MKKVFNYFYKITNTINNKYYYGIHKTNNLDDGYMGSGKRLKYAFKKYGIENFKKDILKYFDTYEKLLKYECDVVTEKLVNDNNCYNLTIGSGYHYINNIKYKNGHIFNKNKIVVKDFNDKNIKIDKSDERLNKTLFSININKTIYKDDLNRIYHLDINDNKIKELNLNGINKNKILVKDKDLNCFLIDRNDKRLNKEFTLFWLNKKHKEETKRKIGEKNSIKQRGEKNSQYGTCWVFNLNIKENQKIKKDELKKWLELGWEKGRKMKWK